MTFTRFSKSEADEKVKNRVLIIEEVAAVFITAVILSWNYVLFWKQLHHPLLTFVAALLYIVPLVALVQWGMSWLLTAFSSLTGRRARRISALTFVFFVPLIVACARGMFSRRLLLIGAFLYLITNLLFIGIYLSRSKLSRRRGVFLDIGSILLLTGLVFLSYYKFLRLEHVFWPGEAAYKFYAGNLYLGRSITQGIFPLWNPYVGLGVPAYAAPEGQFFFPLYLIAAMLSPGYGFYHFVVLGYVVPQSLGAIGFFFLARSLIRRRWIALVVAVAYAFNGFAVYMLSIAHHYAVAWLPWMVLFSLRAFLGGRHSRRWCVAAAVAFALAIVTCYPLLWYGIGLNTLVLALGVGIIKFRRRFIFKLAGKVLLIALLSGAMAAPYLMAVRTYLPFTGREKELPYERAVGENNLTPRNLLSLWFPSTSLMDPSEEERQRSGVAESYRFDMANFNAQPPYQRSLYITIPCLLFALLALAKWSSYRGLPLLLGGLALLYLLLSLGGHSFLYELLYFFIPFFSHSRNSATFRLFFIFYMLLLAALGIRITFRDRADRFLDRSARWMVGIILLITFGFSLYLLATVTVSLGEDLTPFSHLFHDVGFILLFGGSTLLFLRYRRSLTHRKALVVGLFLLVTADAFNFSYASHRFCKHKAADYEDSLGKFRKDFTSVPNVRKRARSWTDPGWVHDFTFTRGTAIVNGPRSTPFCFWPGCEERLDQYANYTDRLFKLYGRVELVPRPAVPLLMRKGDGETAYLDPGAEIPEWFSMRRKGERAQGELEVLRYAPNEARIQVRTPDGALVEMVDRYYPGWRAFLDGEEVPIHRIDVAWKGVFVPPGEHRVSFVFDPPDFLPGILLSAFVFWGSIFLCLIPRFKDIPGE